MWANIIQKKYVFDNTSLFNVQNNDENKRKLNISYSKNHEPETKVL